MKINFQNYKKETSKLAYPIKGQVIIEFRKMSVLELDFDTNSFKMPSEAINEILLKEFNRTRYGHLKDLQSTLIKSDVKYLNSRDIEEICIFLRKSLCNYIERLKNDAKNIGYKLI